MPAAYSILRALLKPVFMILFRPVIIGADNIPAQGGAVIAGNHKHAFDPILIDVSTRRVVRTLAKKELHDGRFGFFFRSAGTIPVDLSAKRNPAAMNAALTALCAGQLVNVSPEARRNFTDELLLPFKFGAAAMSGRTGVPIVPYAIAGDYKLFPHRRLTVIFAEPIYADPEELYSCTKELYNKIAELLYAITDEELLSQKHFTPFDEWSDRNDKTS